MDKAHANTIAISKILDKLNVRPLKVGKSKALYKSPICKENGPSFWVYKDNEWYDYSLSTGGRLTDLAQRYLKFSGENDTLIDALRWIENMASDAFAYPQISKDAYEPNKGQPTLIIRNVGDIRFTALIRYLEERKIPLTLAQRFMREVKVFNKKTGKTFLALGVKNENGGYELKNQVFSGFIRPRTITFIRGIKPRPQSIHIVKDMFDYMSLLQELAFKVWEHDTIVLNAHSCAQLAEPYIKNYGYKTMYSWMDNDYHGHRATSILNSFTKNQPGLLHLKMNRFYTDHLSVNDWHRRKRDPAQ
ncbi:hypothetical protein LZD49_18395 [Dyadobacter sp. CY261]|uniref:hypothetical protein n=1 Tax=Dyadobacter sp. CY261 TaxID=2907203 RepID=UPI001F3BA4E0|nr:hypothetical protein [Dyadobacter sp. CY261]MCF0072459.1 hypothetical protein [Dyadobacter sp. CY261]